MGRSCTHAVAIKNWSDTSAVQVSFEEGVVTAQGPRARKRRSS